MKRMKRQATGRKEIFIKPISPKGYIKDSQNSVIKTNPIRKWAGDINRPSTKEELQMVTKHMKDVQHP